MPSLDGLQHVKTKGGERPGSFYHVNDIYVDVGRQ